MRCPKCHYISFGSVDRCRNCGYEFSLAPDVTPIDLPIQSGDPPIGPLGDLDLGDRPRASNASPAPDAGSTASAPRDSTDRARAGPRAAGPARLDLPLFVDRDPLDDAPLISAPSAPRQPLSVRRAPPTGPRPRLEKGGAAATAFEPRHPDPDARPSSKAAAREDGHESSRERNLDREEDRGHERDVRTLQASPQRSKRAAADADAERPEGLAVAPVWSRLVAGIIDVLILAAIDASVLYSTLRVVWLPFAEVLQLPAIPLAVFLMLLNGGYLAIFTAAGGQTIGKMLTGIRVIAEEPRDDSALYAFTPRVTLGAAVLRATAYLVSLMPAGLGFAAILFDRDGRALHDRLAETRVVKA